MKLIAKITLTTPKGKIPPGGEYNTTDKAEIAALIARGHAAEAPVKAVSGAAKKAEPTDPAAEAAETEAAAKAAAEAEAAAKAAAEAEAAALAAGEQQP